MIYHIIGASLSEPHTSVTAFAEVVCMSVCLRPYTGNSSHGFCSTDCLLFLRFVLHYRTCLSVVEANGCGHVFFFFRLKAINCLRQVSATIELREDQLETILGILEVGEGGGEGEGEKEREEGRGLTAS